MEQVLAPETEQNQLAMFEELKSRFQEASMKFEQRPESGRHRNLYRAAKIRVVAGAIAIMQSMPELDRETVYSGTPLEGADPLHEEFLRRAALYSLDHEADLSPSEVLEGLINHTIVVKGRTRANKKVA